MINLLAYPRSGSSLIRYMLGILTKSLPVQPDGHCEISDLLPDPENSPVIVKYHKVNDGGHLVPSDGKLLLLKRNAIENVLSYMFSNEHEGKKDFDEEYVGEYVNKMIKTDVFIEYLIWYEENIYFYNLWQKEKSYVNYEDLIKKPEWVFKGLAGFCGYTSGDVDRLMEHYDDHKNKILTYKSQRVDPFRMNTGGQLNYFRNLLNEENLEFVCELIK